MVIKMLNKFKLSFPRGQPWPPPTRSGAPWRDTAQNRLLFEGKHESRWFRELDKIAP